MSDLIRAKELLERGGYTCVLCRGDAVYTSRLTGISPMMQFLESETDLAGFSAADKLVGKAAALLFVLAGVEAVYAAVISQSAIETLQKHRISCSYGQVVQTIINRAKTGPCPMEQTVRQLDDPKAAYEALRQTLQRLQAAGSPG